MNEYISRETAVDAGYLSDWYISSVGDEPPVWTDTHIDELLNDFIVIPKDTPAADVQLAKRGRWLIKENHFHSCGIMLYAECSCCGHTCSTPESEHNNYCPNCGADLREDL